MRGETELLLTMEQLEEIVRSDDKQHYSFNDEKQRFAQIRVTPSQLM
jgi:hypothetical protein